MLQIRCTRFLLYFKESWKEESFFEIISVDYEPFKNISTNSQQLFIPVSRKEGGVKEHTKHVM